MQKDNIILLSHTYSSSTPSYGNRDLFKATVNSSIKCDETANSSCWIFTNNHIGTHVDVPYHFNLNGDTITDIPLIDWIFKKVAIVDIPCDEAKLIGIEDIKDISINSEIEILLIRTGYEKYRGFDKYWNDNPGLSPDIAVYLRSNFSQLRCVGFDFISITSWKYRQAGRKAHKAFLSPDVSQRPIIAIEDMSLINLKNTVEWLLVSPIFVENGNGSPVTVFANIPPDS